MDRGDIPDLIPDLHARACRYSSLGMVASLAMYQMLWAFILGRKELTAEEAKEIMSKVHEYGPIRWEDTWDYWAEQNRASRIEGRSFWTSAIPSAKGSKCE